MSGVLIATGCPIGTSTLYRCVHLSEQFARLGIRAAVEDWTNPQNINTEKARGYELLVLHRVAMEDRLLDVIEAAHSSGRTVIFETDDLVFEPQLIQWHRGVDRLSPREKLQYADGVTRYLATLEASDFITTATPFLSGLAHRRGKIALTHRNALGLEMQSHTDALYAERRGRIASERVVIGYGSGTPTHDIDFQQAMAALIETMTRHPNIELWLAGPLAIPNSLLVFKDRLRQFPLSGWKEWLALASHFDINLAPLEPDNLFCRAKSEIKYVEAAALGIPTVATRIDAFNDAITDGVNGFLARSDIEWIEALEQLVTRPGLRSEMGAAAHASVAERYAPDVRASELGTLLAQISGATTSFRSQSQYGGWGKRIRQVERGENRSVVSKAEQSTAISTMVEEHSAPLVINWLVSEPFKGSGGHTTLFRMVKYLVEFGHECHLYIPSVEGLENNAESIRDFVDNSFMVTGASFHTWEGKVYDADATIATHWTTVDHLDDLPNAGRRYYFVQDFEPSFYPMGTEYIRAENTYRKGYHCITIGSWLAKVLRERYQAEADSFDFAVNGEIYYPRQAERSSSPRIVFYARPITPRRAYTLGIEALALVKKQMPQAEILLFGAEKLVPVPTFDHTNLGILNPHELAALYSTCDVGLVLSLTNPSLVPFEMMACGCPVVEMRSEQSQELLTDRETAYLADPTPEHLAEGIVKLIQDRGLREHIAERGYQHVSNRTWRDSARQLEAILLRNAPPDDQRRIKQRQKTGQIPTLLWEINQLLDAEEDKDQQIAELRESLYRVLAEKAQMAAVLHGAELDAREPRARRVSRWSVPTISNLQAHLQQYTPIWVLGHSLLTKIPLTREGLRQTFRADRSHLRSIELRFAPLASPRLGSIRLTLYEGTEEGKLVADRIVSALEISSSAQHKLAFPTQSESYHRVYTLLVRPSDVSATHNFALWRFWRRQHQEATLSIGARPQRGQVAFQAFYGESEDRALPARKGPKSWKGQPRPAISVATDMLSAASGAMSEAYRLFDKARQAVRSRGVDGLADDVLEYLRWRTSEMDD